LPGQANGFGPVAGFADDLEVGFRLQKAPQAIAEDGMVIRNHNSNRL
jgi:hypothetical protein